MAGVARDQFGKEGIRSNVILPSATEQAMRTRGRAEPDLKVPQPIAAAAYRTCAFGDYKLARDGIPCKLWVT
jgi:hypothetical protein